MLRPKHFFAIAAVLLSCLSLPPAAAAPAPSSCSLDVTFDPERSYMKGTADIRFDGDTTLPDSLVCYLHGELRLTGARCGAAELDGTQGRVYYYPDYSLVAVRVAFATANLDRTEPVTVSWEGYFNPSKARTPSDYMRIDGDGVFLRSFGYSLWFPVFAEEGEDPGRTDFDEVVIRTPERYRAVFIGERLSEEVAGGIRIARWRAPGARIFDAQCTARPFEEIAAGGVRVLSMPDDSSRANARMILGFSREAVDFYEEHYRSDARAGETYIMQMPPYGDISNANVTGFATGRWNGFAASEGARVTIAHELVHPVVLLDVPLDDPLYALVVEGFPSYFHYPFLESRLGSDWYESTMEDLEREYRRRRESGLTKRGRKLPREVALTSIAPSEIGAYKDVFVLNDRAVLFFHYLRRAMGEDGFRAFTRSLFSRRSIDFDGFLRLVEETAPEEVENVRTWLTGTEFPESFETAARR